MTFAGRAAVAGIGATEFSKDSRRTELHLACEAVKAALDDAGLAPDAVDGMVTFTMDSTDEIEIARSLGMGQLSFFSRIHHGGGAGQQFPELDAGNQHSEVADVAAVQGRSDRTAIQAPAAARLAPTPPSPARGGGLKVA